MAENKSKTTKGGGKAHIGKSILESWARLSNMQMLRILSRFIQRRLEDNHYSRAAEASRTRSTI